jgi:ABC-type multidrug transport system fused ATPase/permease subunit
VLESGRVRSSGTHDELLKSDDLYRGLVEALRVDPQLATAG